jgi:hypothetical protein
MTKQRRYGTQKTTTKQGKAEYMKNYMPDYRKEERKMLNSYKKMMGIGRRKTL